jgi:hypothetical protein
MVRIRIAPYLLVLAAMLAGCGGSGSTAGTAGASAPTSAEVIAVANKIWYGPGGNPCYHLDIAECPVTARLATRIEQIETPTTTGPGPSNSWCRCQNVKDVVITAEVTPNGGIAHVTFDNAIKVDFVMVEQTGNLLVDDTLCTGKASSTSIYANPLVNCG